MWRFLSPFGYPVESWCAFESNPPGGSSNQRDDDDDEDPPPAGRADAVQLAALNERLRAKKRAADKEAHSLRMRLQEAERKLATQEGKTVLEAADAQTYEAYKALGKPDDVKAKLGQVDTLSGELTGLKRDATLRDVAGAAGYKFTVLRQLGGERDYEVRDATDADGKAAKVAFIKDGDVFKPLAEFAEAAWGDFLPALRASDTGTGTSGYGTGTATSVNYPAQGGGAGTKPPTGAQVAANYVTSTYKGPPKRA